MLFAAGLGTRLRPLTDDRPKAMVEVKGKPLLQWAIEKLIASGSEEIIINVHHFADMIIDFIKKKNNFGVHIEISDERENILETGGGLKKAKWFFDDGKPFLVCNVDILTDLDFNKIYKAHIANDALATLAVRIRPTSRYLLFNGYMELIGWQNIKTGEVRWSRKAVPISTGKRLPMISPPPPVIQPFAFSGIHVMSPHIFEHMLEEDKFSIIEVYLRAMEKEKILGFKHDGDYWLDVGKPEALAVAAHNWGG